MIVFKALLNILFLFIGIRLIGFGKLDYKNAAYTKWVPIFEMSAGIVLSLFSFAVWFVK